MNFQQSIRTLLAAAAFGIALVGAASAQQKPSPAALALAKELMEVKGALKLFDPVISGVIESHRRLLAQTNPNMTRDIDAVAAQLRNEFAPRRTELQGLLVGAYAQYFTEQE